MRPFLKLPRKRGAGLSKPRGSWMDKGHSLFLKVAGSPAQEWGGLRTHFGFLIASSLAWPQFLDGRFGAPTRHP